MHIKNKSLNNHQLKWLALITMVIDHIGAFIIYNCGPLYPDNQIFETLYVASRATGRLAFPIFAFLLVEGFFHTKDLKKYIRNLGIFALISEIPQDLAAFGVPLEISLQNIFLTLFLGLLTIVAFEQIKDKKYIKWCIPITTMIVATLVNSDYGAIGIAVIFIFYLYRDHIFIRNLFAGILLIRQPTAILTLIPINLYNGQRGRQRKFFFYFFYPIHLLLLYTLNVLLF